MPKVNQKISGGVTKAVDVMPVVDEIDLCDCGHFAAQHKGQGACRFTLVDGCTALRPR